MTDLKRALLPLLLVAAVIVVIGAALTCRVGRLKPPGYDVTVSFTPDATQQDIDSTAAILRSFDAKASYLLQETLPPTGRATLHTDASCATVEQQLETVQGVRDASCGIARTPVSGPSETPAPSP